MPVTLSYLTVTPTWESKRLTIAGSVSVRESVALTIVGCGTDTSVVFKLSSENGRVDYAKFPNEVGDAWQVNGDNLTATLNLNTDLLVAAFAPWGPDDRLPLTCSVASATNSNLYAKGCIQIGNWMEDVDDPVAYSTPLADAIDALKLAFAAHDHDGTDAPKVNHANLEAIGINSHDQIDGALTNLVISVQGHDSQIATNTNNILSNANAILALQNKLDLSLIDPINITTGTLKQTKELLNALIAQLKV